MAQHTGLRPEVEAFAALMEEKLRRHDDRPGWQGCSVDDLLGDLRYHVRKLALTLDATADAGDRGRAAADVGNYAMMIADACGALSAPQGEG